MSFSGGVFSLLYNWVTDRNAGVPILAQKFQTEMQDMANGLSTCILKDGTQTLTANIPMAGFRFTGAGNPVNQQDFITLNYLQNNTFTFYSTITALRLANTNGNVPYAVVAGVIYYYDSTDTSTADNGTSVLVSANGNRFKAYGTYKPTISTLSLRNNNGDVFTVDASQNITFTGVIKAPQGSAGAPAYVFSDAATGMWQPTTSVLAFSTGGSERVRIDSSGNVGIGITPTSKLHVLGTDSTVVGLITGSTKAVRFEPTSTGMQIEGIDNTGSASFQPLIVGGSYVAFTNAGTEIARITSVGLGVGITNPSQKLVVSNAGAEGFEIVPGVNSNESRMQAFNRNNTTWNKFSISCSTMQVFSGSGATGGLYQDASGNVAIGGTNPQAALHVTSGQFGVTAARVGVPSSGAGVWIDYNGSVASAVSIFGFDYGGSTSKPISFQGLGGGFVGLGGATSPNVLLDVGGAVATRAGTLSLANGLNSNISTPANSYARISGPTGAFSVGGLTGGVDGRRITLYNSVSQTMTIVQEDASSTAANRIKTGQAAAANLVLAATTPSAVELVYDGTDSRWVVCGHS